MSPLLFSIRRSKAVSYASILAISGFKRMEDVLCMVSRFFVSNFLIIDTKTSYNPLSRHRKLVPLLLLRSLIKGCFLCFDIGMEIIGRNNTNTVCSLPLQGKVVSQHPIR